MHASKKIHADSTWPGTVAQPNGVALSAFPSETWQRYQLAKSGVWRLSRQY
jgi:hypothetical protein